MIDDAETEAVLLVLADPLEWDDFTTRASTASIGAGHWYGVGKQDRGWEVVLEKGGFFRGAHFPSLQEAKAACERHYATGKWE